MKTSKDPTVGKPGVAQVHDSVGVVLTLEAAECETGCVPHLVREVTTTVELGRCVASQWNVRSRHGCAGRHAVGRHHLLGRIAWRLLDGGCDRMSSRRSDVLGCKCLVGVGAHHVDGHADVLGVGRHLHQRVTHCIGAVAVDDVAWVHAITQALGHLLTMAVLDHRMDEDVVIGHLTVEEVPVEHDHAADPQGDDFARGRQHRCGVVTLEQTHRFREVFGEWPAHGGHRPQTRREPGVEYVRIAGVTSRFDCCHEFGFASGIRGFGPTQRGIGWNADRFFDLGGGDSSGVVGGPHRVPLRVDAHRFVDANPLECFDDFCRCIGFVDKAHPYRDLVAPPQLTADAPVADVFVPCLIGAGVPIREEPKFAVAWHFSRSLGHIGRQVGRLVRGLGSKSRAAESVVGYRDVPLVAEPRLDRNMAAIAVSNRVRVVADLGQQLVGVEPFDDGRACIFAAHTHKLAGLVADIVPTVLVADGAVGTHDVDDRQLVAKADVPVVLVVCRSDLEEAAGVLRLGIALGVCHHHIVVANDGNAAADDG